jgi:2'-5' RNA ligase
MTLPPVIRIFFAIDLPAATKAKLGTFIGALKKKSKSHSIRWTKPENLHITLQFLAEVKTEDLGELVENVRLHIEGAIQHGLIKFGTLQLFPNPYRPRVIVLDLTPQEDLATLSKLIGQGITSTRYAIESRPFKGHLTLGRIKNPQGLNLNFLSECESPMIENIELNEVVLFRSEPQPEGSTYLALERIALPAKEIIK